ncbi:MAG: PT domain-containing protein [Candidatus Dormibacteria bacterium]
MTINDGDGLDLDKLLEKELHRQVGPLNGPSARVAQSAYHAAFLTGGTMTPLATLAAMASSKAAAGLAVAALAVGGGSAAVASATGSSNPAVWGKTVTAAVATCKSQLTTGIHGIGDCVSKVAREKGAEERAAHSKDKAGENHTTGTPRDHPTGAPTSHPTGAPTSHPTGAPASHPTGAPTSHPTGAPTSRPSH